MQLTAKQVALLRIILKDFNGRYGNPRQETYFDRVNGTLLEESKALEEALNKTEA